MRLLRRLSTLVFSILPPFAISSSASLQYFQSPMDKWNPRRVDLQRPEEQFKTHEGTSGSHSILMDDALRDCLVTGYLDLVESLGLP